VGAPETWLAKLPPDDEVAAGKVRGLGPVVPQLVEAGWVSARKDGRALMVRLTEAGQAERARLAALPPPPPRAKPTRAPRAPRTPAARPTTAATRLAALEAAVAALTERVAALEAPAVAPGAASALAPPPPAADPAALRQAIVAAIGDLDARGRLGGLVPIPELRRELVARGVTAAAAEVDAALEDLERAWTIDLSVAQAPTQVAERAAGIERPGRGLLYYVARR
jgi:DNA-binding MarR family transcriptional regulator